MALLLAVAGCRGAVGALTDGGAPPDDSDAGPLADGGDAGSIGDAGGSDAGDVDAGPGDAGPGDAGPGDAGPPPSSLLFWSGFEGNVSLGTPTDCYNNGCFQDVSGLDTSTGFTWPLQLSGGTTRFQLLANSPSGSTPSDIGDFMFNDLRTVTGHTGAQTRVLYSEIDQSGCCGTDGQGGGSTQDSFHILPGADVPDMYLSFWRMYQADLFDKMAAGDPWRVVFEWKTAGDFRIICSIVGWNGPTPSWQIVGDNDANGGLPHEEYWREYNSSVPVPAGEWFKYEVYWHRSSGNDGRVWMAVNGTTIVDHYGPTIGVNDAPIDRIFLSQTYSGSPYPIYQWQDDVQVWSTFPTAAPGDPWYDPPYGDH